jgi:hypothetical protein
MELKKVSFVDERNLSLHTRCSFCSFLFFSFCSNENSEKPQKQTKKKPPKKDTPSEGEDDEAVKR